MLTSYTVLDKKVSFLSIKFSWLKLTRESQWLIVSEIWLNGPFLRQRYSRQRIVAIQKFHLGALAWR